MSPFTQFNSNLGYGGGIDKNFSSILNYLDEIDRHFSHHHRFLNCFIPRFDLEEDAHSYFLYGDIPGARVEDINIEAHDNHTLAIEGHTHHVSSPLPQSSEAKQYPPEHPEHTPGEGEDPFVKVNVDNKERGDAQPKDNNAVIPTHPYHARSTSFIPPPHHPPPSEQRRHLLSERLVGDFHRTFAFPSPVQEEGVQASMENGVLFVVVPKRESTEIKKGRKIPISSGNRSSGFGFNSGAV